MKVELSGISCTGVTDAFTIQSGGPDDAIAFLAAIAAISSIGMLEIRRSLTPVLFTIQFSLRRISADRSLAD